MMLIVDRRILIPDTGDLLRDFPGHRLPLGE
jgi:hypothetical protein